MCKDEGMALAPWGALGGGKFKTEEQRKSDEGRKAQVSDIDIQVSKVLEKIATRKNTVITSVALAYVVQKTPYVFPIVGGRTLNHLKHNIEALTLQLTEEDIEEIEKAYPFDLGFPNSMLWGQNGSGNQQKIWLLEAAAHYEYVPEVKVCWPSFQPRLAALFANGSCVAVAHCVDQSWRVEPPLSSVELEMVAGTSSLSTKPFSAWYACRPWLVNY